MAHLPAICATDDTSNAVGSVRSPASVEDGGACPEHWRPGIDSGAHGERSGRVGALRDVSGFASGWMQQREHTLESSLDQNVPAEHAALQAIQSVGALYLPRSSRSPLWAIHRSRL